MCAADGVHVCVQLYHVLLTALELLLVHFVRISYATITLYSLYGILSNPLPTLAQSARLRVRYARLLGTLPSWMT